jgi:GT2 family glycosyltransferase
MKKADILIVGVIYNTYPETIRYLDSLASIAHQNFTLILVDNSNKATPPDFLQKTRSYPFLHYLKSESNIGYFRGAQAGLNHYLAKHADYPQWILVTNVDIVFTPDFFHRLNTLPDQPHLGVVAPSIISKKWNTDYNPKIITRYSVGKLKFYRFLYTSFILHNLFLTVAYFKKWVLGLVKKRSEISESHNQNYKKIYAPHGSCIVFKKTYFTLGGALDLSNFLFGEEILVAETALQLGLDVEYHPELVIDDYEHASTGFFISPAVNRYNHEAIQAILDRYYT